MKSSLIISLFFLLLTLLAAGSGNYSPVLTAPPDSVPPPPPGGPNPLTGPTLACVGESSVYATDVPVACTCQWYINDILQPQTSSPLVINWAIPGPFDVTVIFQCSNGLYSDPETISVNVFETPQPQPISGDQLVCEYTYHTYSTVVGPSDSCEWTVNGVIQPGYSPSITYVFGDAGIYGFEVVAFNPCGTSSPQTLEVTAQGTAPSTPTPIQGPGESCEGETEIYTTTVGPGESCSWWIDGILQATTSTTLEVNWDERGDHLIEVRAVSDCGTGNPAYKNVLVLYLPYVFLGNDTTILQGQTLVLDAGNTGSDYLWSTGETTQTIQVTLTGNYAVNVSNFCGTDADTIEVSVYTGIEESMSPNGCFTFILDRKNINFITLPEGVLKIQVSGLSGVVFYKGPPIARITVPQAGIYFIKVISPDTTCYKKVFIP